MRVSAKSKPSKQSATDPIPPFTVHGLLPVGEYEVTLEELEASHLVHGAGRDPWDAKWRAKLVANLRTCVNVLRQAGVTEIYVDGSFVEDKPHPGDIDGYFHCTLMDYVNRDLHRRLNAADPNTTWTWENHARSPHGTSTKAQLPMWHTYRVEFYPHYEFNHSGIMDEYGQPMPFPSAFRQQRGTRKQKGILKIIERTA
ncbi:MAG TPA: hypothetical protein VGD01_12960 [Candidatus Elarobacter sp.]